VNGWFRAKPSATPRPSAPGVVKPNPGTGQALLEVEGLQVYYGRAHAVQGVSLRLASGVLGVVGRNGMGKTTLCHAIAGLVPAMGSIRFKGREVLGMRPHQIARLGISLVPQGRRVWPSLSVDETLRLVASTPGDRDRVYTLFPRLAERRSNGGHQLSGGEQQMLAIGRALLLQPALLIMDEPTEGLAPVIVEQLTHALRQLSRDDAIAILLIEQNLRVALGVADRIAVMVNGRIAQEMLPSMLASNPELQERLLGVRSHRHDDDDAEQLAGDNNDRQRDASAHRGEGVHPVRPAQPAQPAVIRVLRAHADPQIRAPEAPSWVTPAARFTVWNSASVAAPAASDSPAASIAVRAAAIPVRAATVPIRAASNPVRAASAPASDSAADATRANLLNGSTGALPSIAATVATHAVSPGPNAGPTVRLAYVAGTFDTKRRELEFLAKLLEARGIRVTTVDLSTSGQPSMARISARDVARHHPAGEAAVFCGDRGAAVSAMGLAFAHFVRSRRDVGGLISAGGSGGTSIATAGMRALDVGLPKVMVSTMASGDTRPYVGPSDICMLYPITDVQGINRISEQVLSNAAHALAGMIQHPPRPRSDSKPAIGLSMFGVTTPCVQAVARALEADYDCVVFHATGVGGQSMEKLADSGLLAGVIDISTTEIADEIVGGTLSAGPERLDVFTRHPMPWVGSVGALDMVNFGPFESVPERFRNRRLYRHNPNVTLMRTTPEECVRIGQFLVEKLNRMGGPVRLLLPEHGLSAIDREGQPFWDPQADRALLETLEAGFQAGPRRRLDRLALHLNDPAFAQALVEAWREVAGYTDGQFAGTGERRSVY
jgi:uncharacterized protein (UPF0261 family)/ABC-type branched-subunit amino acid transport system ATPase component